MLIDEISGFRLVTAPATEPVSLATARTALRADGLGEDEYIMTLITVAREWAEAFTNRALITQTWRATFDNGTLPTGNIIELPRPPLVSVTSITYVDTDGDQQTLATSYYTVDTETSPGRILFEDMPAIKSTLSSLVVNYTCGYGASGDDVPSRFHQAILYLVNHFYENRLPVQMAGNPVPVPMTAEWLLKELKVRWL